MPSSRRAATASRTCCAAAGCERLDHYSIFMENNARYLEMLRRGRARRAVLHLHQLVPDRRRARLHHQQQRVEGADHLARRSARSRCEALAQCPNVELLPGRRRRRATARAILDLDEATAGFPDTPIADESLGTAMLYSSGTTGRPKGILRPLPEQPPAQPLPLFEFLHELWRYREGMIYLSPAPLYHSAPQAAVGAHDPHAAAPPSSWSTSTRSSTCSSSSSTASPTASSCRRCSRACSSCPTRSRAATTCRRWRSRSTPPRPCPVQVKEQMIDWWGPIILEYYGATEGMGFTACDTAEWLAHRGTVGQVAARRAARARRGHATRCRRARPARCGSSPRPQFDYFNDPEKTAKARSPDGTMSTVGDVGYVDDDGYLYLTDRTTFMIISGGVNIYPQECENLLITHPKVADAAVFGVPNDDLGEEVKAVVQPMPGIEPGPELADELIAFCARAPVAPESARARSTSRPSCRACRPASSTSAAARPLLG